MGFWSEAPMRQRLGVWEQSPQPPEARESGDETPSAGRFLQFFNKNNTFLCNFGQNSYLKAITHQLKAFEKQSKRTK